MTETFTLPLDRTAIERILPHRYPFLLVDRVTELEPDRRIVGLKNVTRNERFLTRTSDGRLAMPPGLLVEAVAQVGAIMILIKPANRGKLVFFSGIERVRFRGLVEPGDVLTLEATVRRLGSRMGVLEGTIHVDGRRVANGAMSFAFAPPGAG